MVAERDIKLYKGSDKTFVFAFEEGGMPHLLPGVNTLRLYKRPVPVPFLEIDVTATDFGVNNLDVPVGWRLPTEAEWNAERLSWDTNDRDGAFGSNLKIPVGGIRRNDATLFAVGSGGGYWSDTLDGTRAKAIEYGPSDAAMVIRTRSHGRSIRLIKETGSSLVAGDQTFIYSGASWTYQEVTSATGRIWMDRNLGASQVATAYNDSDAYGDLFQWGRNIDGHQVRTSGTTATLSSTDDPGHGLFITTSTSPNDWRDPQNDNLWQYLGSDADYRAVITNAQSSLLQAIEYFYEFRNVDTLTKFPVKGKMAVTDVYTSNKITRVGTIEYDSTTKYYK